MALKELLLALPHAYPICVVLMKPIFIGLGPLLKVVTPSRVSPLLSRQTFSNNSNFRETCFLYIDVMGLIGCFLISKHHPLQFSNDFLFVTKKMFFLFFFMLNVCKIRM